MRRAHGFNSWPRWKCGEVLPTTQKWEAKRKSICWQKWRMSTDPRYPRNPNAASRATSKKIKSFWQSQNLPKMKYGHGPNARFLTVVGLRLRQFAWAAWARAKSCWRGTSPKRKPSTAHCQNIVTAMQHGNSSFGNVRKCWLCIAHNKHQ